MECNIVFIQFQSRKVLVNFGLSFKITTKRLCWTIAECDNKKATANQVEFARGLVQKMKQMTNTLQSGETVEVRANALTQQDFFAPPPNIKHNWMACKWIYRHLFRSHELLAEFRVCTFWADAPVTDYLQEQPVKMKWKQKPVSLGKMSQRQVYFQFSVKHKAIMITARATAKLRVSIENEHSKRGTASQTKQKAREKSARQVSMQKQTIKHSFRWAFCQSNYMCLLVFLA